MNKYPLRLVGHVSDDARERTIEGIKVVKKVLDEEEFSIEPGSLDFVISCISLHWANDLPGCFQRIMNSLKKDGVFMAAIFGGDSLYELRSVNFKHIQLFVLDLTIEIKKFPCLIFFIVVRYNWQN